MTHSPPALSRRTLLAGLGGTILVPPLASWTSSRADAEARPTPALRAVPGRLALVPGTPTPAWLLSGADEILRFKQGDEIDISLQNDLPVPVALMWRGLGGVARAEPLLGQPPVAAGGKDAFRLPLRHAGTGLLDARLLGDGQALPSPARACVVQETAPPQVDRDEVWLIEDFRLRADGTAIAPGSDPKDAAPLFTVNGKAALELTARFNERLRIRIINGCQRAVIALRIEDQEIRVMAMDGQPAEPFLARNSQLVLAPGSRIDAFIDITKAAGTTSGLLLHDGKQARTIGKLVVSGEAPIRDRPLPPLASLPSNGLPAKLDLKSAQRIDLTIGGAASAKPEWVKPAGITASAPAFRVKPGRVVVLAITNRENTPAVFHLHGHHFRLLDRLDDGWKPYWLDTLAMQPNQTHRIAFAADTPGRWGMESFTTDWAAPRLMRWFETA